MAAIDPAHFDALLFDLDGVVTRTAGVHATAWKRAFDELLASRARGQPWDPFDIDREYRRYVDGKPRRDGIRSFLLARGIALPEGTPSDGPAASTVHGLAARKQRNFVEQLATGGVEVYPDAVVLLLRARAAGLQTAVVSASENAAMVLEAAALTEMFDVRVDGVDAHRLGLRGKPAPETFLEAAHQLGAPPRRCVVFEDALAGVRAGRAGGFGLVVGVDRVGEADTALRADGADLVVTALDELEVLRGGAETVQELR